MIACQPQQCIACRRGQLDECLAVKPLAGISGQQVPMPVEKCPPPGIVIIPGRTVRQLVGSLDCELFSAAWHAAKGTPQRQKAPRPLQEALLSRHFQYRLHSPLPEPGRH